MEYEIENVKCEVKRKDNGGYHILINGFDIAPYITKFSLNLNEHRSIPTVNVEIPVCLFECEEICNMIVNGRRI